MARMGPASGQTTVRHWRPRVPLGRGAPRGRTPRRVSPPRGGIRAALPRRCQSTVARQSAARLERGSSERPATWLRPRMLPQTPKEAAMVRKALASLRRLVRRRSLRCQQGSMGRPCRTECEIQCALASSEASTPARSARAMAMASGRRGLQSAMKEKLGLRSLCFQRLAMVARSNGRKNWAQESGKALASGRTGLASARS
mmetsp:Transcript_23033/g.64395  ORF Transcript_23033/g.64395 Transcript_23033/m.64395 type:complete len:201 (+) Transcript_23033:753-1355(+)